MPNTVDVLTAPELYSLNGQFCFVNFTSVKVKQNKTNYSFSTHVVGSQQVKYFFLLMQ